MSAIQQEARRSSVGPFLFGASAPGDREALRLWALLLAVVLIGYAFAAARANAGDDDFILLYVAGQSMVEPDAVAGTATDSLTALAAAGYPPAALQRTRFRLDHRSNYLADALGIAAARTLLPSATPAGWPERVRQRLVLGLALSHGLIALAVFLLLRRRVPLDGLRVLAPLVVAYGLAVALFQFNAPLREAMVALKGEGRYLAGFAVRALELSSREMAAGGLIGFSPRSAFALLVAAVYLLRRQGHYRAGYALAALSVLVHSSHGYLLMLLLAVLDGLRGSARRADAGSLCWLLFGALLAAGLDRAWAHLAGATGGLGYLPLLLPAALLAAAGRWLPPRFGAVHETDFVLLAGAALLLLAWGSRQLLPALLGTDGLGLLLGKAAGREQGLALKLVVLAAVDFSLHRSPWLRAPARSSVRLLQPALLATLVLLPLAHIAAPPGGRPPPDPRQLSDGQLRDWLRAPAIEAIDGLVFATLAREIDVGDGAQELLLGRLRNEAAAPEGPGTTAP